METPLADINEIINFVGDCNEKCKTVLLTKDNFVFLDEIIYPSKEMTV
jgi:tRNA threonylcarbamoyladenosine biosynthesis protein TsaB